MTVLTVVGILFNRLPTEKEYQMKVSIIIAAALFCGHAAAQTFGVHTFSQHGHDSYTQFHGNDAPPEVVKFNEKNWGLYYINRDGWMIGGYRNSYYHNTFYAGYMWDGPTFGPIGTHIAGAIATGYSEVQGVGLLRPMLMPSLTLAAPMGVSARWSVAPAKGGLFMHLSFEKKF